MKRIDDRTIGLIGGFFLGLGAPAGAILMRSIAAGVWPGGPWVEAEFSSNFFFYFYMMFTTPFAFMAFGGYLGALSDKARSQNKMLEYLMGVVQKQSITDEATGVFNRRYLFEQIEKELERSTRYGHALSGIMIDVDNFKEINDHHGHPTGDRILSDLAHILIKSVRNIDTVGRYGGDEFIILLPESKQTDAHVVAERILSNTRNYRPKSHTAPDTFAVSIGVFSHEGTSALTAVQFVEKIDRALLGAKALGKNRIYPER